MWNRVAVALTLVAAGAGIVPGDETAPRAAKELQGEWVGIKLELNGEKASEEDAKAFKMSIKGDEISLMTCRGDRCITRKKTFKLDTTKSPMWIDLLTLDGKEKGTTQLSIVSIEQDRLRICTPFSVKASAERPAEFKTRAGDGMLLIELRRVVPK